MTPIEQKIQAAIEAGYEAWQTVPSKNIDVSTADDHIHPLVMAELKPLLDDARAVIKFLPNDHTADCPCVRCSAVARILAATEPGSDSPISPTCLDMANGFGHDQAKTMGIPLTNEPFADFQKRTGFGIKAQGPGADSSPDANKGRDVFSVGPSASVPPGPLSEITLCPRCEGCGIYNFGPCSLCEATGRLGFDGKAFKPVSHEPLAPTSNCTHNWHATCSHCDSEQSRQAAAGVPDNDGVTQKNKYVFIQCADDDHRHCDKETYVDICACPCHTKKEPHPLGVYGVDWVMTTWDEGNAHYIENERHGMMHVRGRWIGCQASTGNPRHARRHTTEAELPEPEALAFLAEHPIPPDKLKLAAKVPEPPANPKPWSADIAAVLAIVRAQGKQIAAMQEKGGAA